MRADPLVEIAILQYPDAQGWVVHGLTDLFRIANRQAAEHDSGPGTRIRVTHWQWDPSARTVTRSLDTHPGAESRPAYLVLPPSLGEPLVPDAVDGLSEWLREHHQAGATLCSVCAGAFLLARTGLLAGRRATTHWSFTDELSRCFPDIRVEGDRMIVDDGDIITAGGMMAWTDLGLTLVERLIDTRAMLATARFLLVDPPGREQRCYGTFSPNLRHGDEAVLKVQHWLQAEGARETSLGVMAAKAGLEERTFLRRFVKATGIKPTAYCQQLRVERARQALELTNRTVEQIAWEVGYEDAGAFRKVFQKVLGVSPGDYRRRFGAVGARGAAEAEHSERLVDADPRRVIASVASVEVVA